LVLEGNDGGEQWVQTAALRDLFRLFSSKVRCVLLNACYSEEQASEIVNHIDHVIGMEQEIRDDAAIAFSKGFYRALGYDCSIEEAYEFGCNAIQLEITGRSTVRSAAAELTRKAEVINAVATTIIPEHMKPILKKREGVFRAEEWRNSARQAVSQTKKEAIQLELVQEVIDTPRNRDLSAQPMMNPSNVPASQVSQGLLEVPAPHRRRVAPLLVGSMVAGLLPVIGIYSYIKLGNQPKSTDSTQPRVTVSPMPPTPIVPPSPAEPPKLEQISLGQAEQNLLGQAKDLAMQKKWKEAIDTLKQISETAPISDREQLLAERSENLWQSAQEYCSKGELDKAIQAGEQTVERISRSSRNYDDVLTTLANWKKDKELWSTIDDALRKSDVQTPTQLIGNIQDLSLQKGLEIRIEHKSEEIAAVKAAAWQKYKYAWLSGEEVTDAKLQDKPPSELEIMRNSIYAKHGRIFENPELENLFKQERWYQPISPNVDSLLSPLESKNADKIRDFETKMGYLTE
jgi:tetratricopeptide (TPR) repeat protein